MPTPLQKSKAKFCDAAFLLGLVVGVCFLVWRAPFGFAINDEAFYLSVPYRLIMGDGLLVDEWHLSQLAGFLLYPLLRVYFLFVPNTEGLILSFRYIYVAVQSLATVYIYLRLRRVSPWGALFAAAAFFLYTPFSIMELSYNSMGIILMSAACVTVATSREGRPPELLLTGLLLAGAVLCCPYLALAYLAYSAAVLFRALRVRSGCETALPAEVFGGRRWLFLSLGAGLLAVIFVVFVLSRADVSDILAALPQMLSDPEHPDASSMGFLIKSRTYLTSLFYAHAYSGKALVAAAALLTAVLLDRRRTPARKCVYALLAVGVTALYDVPFLCAQTRNINFLMLPMNILGLFAYLLTDKRRTRLFLTVFVPGVIYSFCIHQSSNLGLINISSVSSVSLLATMVFITDFVSELLSAEGKTRRPAAAMAALLLLCMAAQLVFQASTRARVNLFDAPTAELNHTIAYGPEKGLRTTEETARTQYYDQYEATESIRERPEGHVLYFSGCTWLYLADRKEFGAYSAYLSLTDPDIAVQRLLEYWRLDPTRKADCIYISRDYLKAAEYARALNLDDLPVQETELGYIIIK